MKAMNPNHDSNQDSQHSQEPAQNEHVSNSPDHDEVETDSVESSASEDLSETSEASEAGDDSQQESGGRPRRKKKPLREIVLPELRRLAELTTRYPEIGAPLADLALKLGHRDLSQRLLNVALEGGEEGIDARFLSAELARREGRYTEVLEHVLAALSQYAESGDENTDRGARLLHLVRQGFAVVMFELGDISAHSEFSKAITENLLKLEDRFQDNAFFYTLLAQAQWSTDRELSEQTWERAIELGEPESTWNARGTWYKEAENDLERAEQAYLRGLEAAPASALLLHNLAQIMMTQAEQEGMEPEEARRKLIEARTMLRRALKYGMRVTLRRHIHETIERLDAQLTTLPVPATREPRQAREPRQPRQPVAPPKVGDIVTGRVRSTTIYGVFLSISREQSGLLHKTEISHEVVEDPARLYSVGDEIEVKIIDVRKLEDGTLRVSFSRKALLPEPEETDASGVQHATRLPRANTSVSTDKENLPDQTLGNRSRQRRPRNEDGRSGQRGARRRDPQDSAPGESKSSEPLGTIGDLLRSRQRNEDDPDADQ